MTKKLQLTTNPVPPRAITLDTETTGLSPRHGDRIVELGAIELIHGIPSGRTFHAYINPRRPVPSQAVRVHGLDNRFLADKPTFEEILPEWLEFLGAEDTPLWAHNASFDRRFLEAEHALQSCTRSLEMSCSLRLARAIFGKGTYTLDVLAARAGARFSGRGAHSALSDATVLADILCGLLWPEEIRVASRSDATVVKTPVPARPVTRAVPDEEAETIISLPQGFQPLTPASDSRLRRYDDLVLDGLLTARGKRWSRSEEQELVSGFLAQGCTIPDLVAQHGRSPAALLLKLEGLGVIAEHPYARG